MPRDHQGSSSMLPGVPDSQVLAWVIDEAGRPKNRTADVDEVVSVAAAMILAKSTSFVLPGAARPETWVRRQVQYATLRVRRAQHRSWWQRAAVNDIDALPGDEGGCIDELVTQEELAALADCEKKLRDPTKTRWLSFRAGRGDRLARDVIARTLGISLDTLKTSVTEAMLSIRRCLSLKGILPPGAAAGGGEGA